MTTIAQATRNEFIGNIYKAARELVTRELAGEKSLVIGLELGAFARAYDIGNLSSEFLDAELEVLNGAYDLDGHNWSDFYRAINTYMIEIVRVLVVRKDRVGA